MKETVAFRADKRDAAMITELSDIFDDPVALKKGCPSDVLRWFCLLMRQFIADGTVRWDRGWLQERLQRKQAYEANAVNGANGPKLLRAGGADAGRSSSTRLGGPLRRISIIRPDFQVWEAKEELAAYTVTPFQLRYQRGRLLPVSVAPIESCGRVA